MSSNMMMSGDLHNPPPQTRGLELPSLSLPFDGNLWWLCLSFVMMSCVKILLFPSYYSTDLLVHRHWKALTRHLPMRAWYADDWMCTDEHSGACGSLSASSSCCSTIHTLDYPPAFAYFEAFWSSKYNPLTQTLLLDHRLVDERCLALVSDADLAETPPSTACVAFLRSTVVLSDAILWWGAWRVVQVTSTISSNYTSSSSSILTWTVFLLMICHPGLLWLDHIHFQYNGMLLGILLLSLSFLLQQPRQQQQQSSPTTTTTSQVFNQNNNSTNNHHLLIGAALFALLLNLKHLYLTLSLWYTAYLLRAYCFLPTIPSTATVTTTIPGCHSQQTYCFHVRRFFILACVTGTVLLLPWLPLLMDAESAAASESAASDSSSQTYTSLSASLQLVKQIISRLFPFERGIVHDYWAANVWAYVMAFHKVISRLFNVQPQHSSMMNVSPQTTVVVLLPALLVGAYHGWKAARDQSPLRTIVSLTFSALASFQLGYHVHEKAIMTSLLPALLLLLFPTPSSPPHQYPPMPHTPPSSEQTETSVPVKGAATATVQPVPALLDGNNCCSSSVVDFRLRCLVWELTVWGVLGLSPLLFQPRELLFKITSYYAYTVALTHVCFEDYNNDFEEQVQSKQADRSWILRLHGIGVCIVACVYEIVPLSLWGRYEFAPLALTSLACATALISATLRLLYWLVWCL